MRLAHLPRRCAHRRPSGQGDVRQFPVPSERHDHRDARHAGRRQWRDREGPTQVCDSRRDHRARRLHLLGGRGEVSSQGALQPIEGGPLPLVTLAVPAVVIAMLVKSQHPAEALLIGILSAVVVGLVFGLLAPVQPLRVEPGSFGATGLVVDGLGRALEVIVFTLLLIALVGTLQVTDLRERSVQAATGRAQGGDVDRADRERGRDAHDAIGGGRAGDWAGFEGDGGRFGILRYRGATWPFPVPWFLLPFLPASTSAGASAGGALGAVMPAVGAPTVGVMGVTMGRGEGGWRVWADARSNLRRQPSFRVRSTVGSTHPRF